MSANKIESQDSVFTLPSLKRGKRKQRVKSEEKTRSRQEYCVTENNTSSFSSSKKAYLPSIKLNESTFPQISQFSSVSKSPASKSTYKQKEYPQILPSSPRNYRRTGQPTLSHSPQKQVNFSMEESMKKAEEFNFAEGQKIGEGNFGLVYKVTFKEAKLEVAVKRVLQDKQFKNRELQIMIELFHPNIVSLKHSFFSFVNNGTQQDVYLNIVMEYVPSTLANMIKFYHRHKPKKGSPPAEQFPDILLKLYLYQTLRALAYLQGKRIAHRDIKPTNILINHRTHALKLCDFGSAKRISFAESNISYICSRYYRAPELLLGSSSYDASVDIWSLGCVFAEMVLGEQLFKGDSNLDQLVEVMKVLGTPTPEEIKLLNLNHKITSYPPINKIPLKQVLSNTLINPDLLDLLNQMIIYEPNKRIKPLRALTHNYFNELRIEQCRINGKKLPPLFNFTPEEVQIIEKNKMQLHELTPRWFMIQKQAQEDKQKQNQLSIF